MIKDTPTNNMLRLRRRKMPVPGKVQSIHNNNKYKSCCKKQHNGKHGAQEKAELKICIVAIFYTSWSDKNCKNSLPYVKIRCIFFFFFLKKDSFLRVIILLIFWYTVTFIKHGLLYRKSCIVHQVSPFQIKICTCSSRFERRGAWQTDNIILTLRYCDVAGYKNETSSSQSVPE